MSNFYTYILNITYWIIKLLNFKYCIIYQNTCLILWVPVPIVVLIDKTKFDLGFKNISILGPYLEN